MNISKKIYILRKKCSMTQEELAEKLNVSRQAITRWERGQSVPSAENLVCLSRVFNVSVDSLVNDEKSLEMRSEVKRVSKNKYIFLGASILVLIFERAIPILYFQDLQGSVFTSRYFLSFIGVIFTFLFMMYVALVILELTKQVKYKVIIRGICIVGSVFCWWVLYWNFRRYTFLINSISPYVALCAWGIAVIEEVFKEKKKGVKGI